MNLNILLIQVGLSLGISLAVVLYLRDILHRVLLELCEGHAAGARYWVRLLDVMMVIAPLILVILLPDNGDTGSYELVRRSLLFSLLGQFGALLVVGYNINQYARADAARRFGEVVPSAGNAAGVSAGGEGGRS